MTSDSPGTRRAISGASRHSGPGSDPSRSAANGVTQLADVPAKGADHGLERCTDSFVTPAKKHQRTRAMRDTSGLRRKTRLSDTRFAHDPYDARLLSERGDLRDTVELFFASQEVKVSAYHQLGWQRPRVTLVRWSTLPPQLADCHGVGDAFQFHGAHRSEIESSSPTRKHAHGVRTKDLTCLCGRL